MESGGAQAAASWTDLRSSITLGDDPIQEKRRGMESGGAQAAASSTAAQGRTTLGDDNPIEEKRRRMESGCAQAIVSSTAQRSSVALRDDGRPLDGIRRAEIIPDCKHADGSINTSTDFWSKVFCLSDTNETCLEPMMMTRPLKSCLPFWEVCQAHSFCAMMQIFSLKFTSSVAGPVQLYGYMAVRDLLNPWRNYIFNRTRDDPFAVGQDGFIQMSGPKRGISMDGYVLIEYDIKIKREEGDDLQLIDGAACFNNLGLPHASVNTRRIDGDCGAVDIAFAKMPCAAEATIHVGVSELEHGSGFSMCVTASCVAANYLERIQLFDGVIAADKPEVNRSVVAVPCGVKLYVALRLSQSGVSDPPVVSRFCVFEVRKHGGKIFNVKLDFATIHVKVMWSTLDIPESLLGPNCYLFGDAVTRIK